MRLIDTHAHIHDAEFDGDRDAMLERARSHGVDLIVTLGVDAANSRLALDLAERTSQVIAAVGVHPHDAKDASEADLDALETLAAHPRVAMIGEIGLDFYRNLSPRDCQIEVLLRQLETAGRVGKPVAVHTRAAGDDMLPILEAWSREHGGRLLDGRPLGVMHYFSEDEARARKYVEMGFMISIHTSVTHPKTLTLQAVARDAPLASLVIETDSPYGAPQRHRGKRNEPAYVAEAAARIAALKGVDVDHVAAVTTDNALSLLGAAVSPSAGSGQ